METAASNVEAANRRLRFLKTFALDVLVMFIDYLSSDVLGQN